MRSDYDHEGLITLNTLSRDCYLEDLDALKKMSIDYNLEGLDTVH
jgi:hypothetical protein